MSFSWAESSIQFCVSVILSYFFKKGPRDCCKKFQEKCNSLTSLPNLSNSFCSLFLKDLIPALLSDHWFPWTCNSGSKNVHVWLKCSEFPHPLINTINISIPEKNANIFFLASSFLRALSGHVRIPQDPPGSSTISTYLSSASCLKLWVSFFVSRLTSWKLLLSFYGHC